MVFGGAVMQSDLGTNSSLIQALDACVIACTHVTEVSGLNHTLPQNIASAGVVVTVQ